MDESKAGVNAATTTSAITTTHPTHIIIQTDKNTQEFINADINKCGPTFLMKVDNDNVSTSHTPPPIQQTTTLSKIGDPGTSVPPTMSFEIIQESLHGDSFFSYNPVFNHEDNRFVEQHDDNHKTIVITHGLPAVCLNEVSSSMFNKFTSCDETQQESMNDNDLMTKDTHIDTDFEDNRDLITTKPTTISSLIKNTGTNLVEEVDTASPTNSSGTINVTSMNLVEKANSSVLTASNTKNIFNNSHIASLSPSSLPVPVASSSLSVQSSLSEVYKKSSEGLNSFHKGPSIVSPSIPSDRESLTSSNLLLHENSSDTQTDSSVKISSVCKDTIKKTIVEAFVKMVVCRKITVQKVDSKKGTVLDMDIRMEEEEPVVLSVDRVETTEDMTGDPSSACKSEEKSKPSLSSSKLGTGIDGGLKFLSAVSESRQKINPSLLSNAFLQSTLPSSISKALISDSNDKISTSTPCTTDSTSTTTTDQELVRIDDLHHDVKTEAMDEPLNCVKIEDILDEDLDNDMSTDYLPPYERKLMKNRKLSSILNASSESKILTKCSKEVSDEDNHSPATGVPSSLITPTIKSGSNVLLFKKRGRKRRWDKALGLVPNLKTCQFCNKQFDQVKECSDHMREGACISALFCYICIRPFDSEEDLEKHILSHGRSPDKTISFDCNDCQRSYRTRAGYVKHFRMGTCSKRDEFEDGKSGDFPCSLCRTVFSNKDYLKLHQYKVHENPKDQHYCKDCGKKFHSFLGFQRHKSARPCTEPLKCRVCGKTYKSKESFKIHMKHHKSEISGEMFDCDVCARSYMTQTALTKHKLSHTGVKPYKCETCGKEFAMRYQVKDHARTHTGERPFLCKLCGSAFSNKGHLGRHIRSHENGTLTRRGRPKKISVPDGSSSLKIAHVETSGAVGGLKLIDIASTLQTIDGQTVQVVDGQLFESSNSGNPPMIIHTDNNTIIFTESWPQNSAELPKQQPATNDVSSASLTSSGINETNKIDAIQ